MEGHMADGGCDRGVQLCSEFRWHGLPDDYATSTHEYGLLMRHPCCDTDPATCGDNIDCALPRTGKCMDIPECPERYRFNIYTELCEYIFECPETEEYDWHGENCFTYKNFCDQNEDNKMNLYHHCVDNCDAWKVGDPDYEGQFDLEMVFNEDL